MATIVSEDLITKIANTGMTVEQFATKIRELRERSGPLPNHAETVDMRIVDELRRAIKNAEQLSSSLATEVVNVAANFTGIRAVRAAALRRAIDASSVSLSDLAAAVYSGNKRSQSFFPRRLQDWLECRQTVTDNMAVKLAAALGIPVEEIKVREMTPVEHGRYNKVRSQKPRTSKVPRMMKRAPKKRTSRSGATASARSGWRSEVNIRIDAKVVRQELARRRFDLQIEGGDVIVTVRIPLKKLLQ